MKVKNITREFLKDFRIQLDHVLQELGEKEGIKLTAGHCSYSDTYFSIKIEGAIETEEGVATTKDQIAFKDNAELFGLSPDDLFKTFETGGKSYEVWGLKPRSKKYPILAKEIGTDKVYKFKENTVKFYLKLQEAEVK
jgi:hypothetical protein|tara:strand:- start:1717 stop:2130 length:414 start_codon:yes stop_codon:yes gene_type:complete